MAAVYLDMGAYWWFYADAEVKTRAEDGVLIVSSNDGVPRVISREDARFRSLWDRGLGDDDDPQTTTTPGGCPP